MCLTGKAPIDFFLHGHYEGEVLGIAEPEQLVGNFSKWWPVIGQSSGVWRVWPVWRSFMSPVFYAMLTPV